MKTQFCLRWAELAGSAVLTSLLVALTSVPSRAAPGDVDLSFDARTVITNNYVNSVAVQSDGKILVVGRFTATVNGIARKNVSRLNPDGSPDRSFLATGTEYSADAVSVQNDGKILIGGDFGRMNGEEHQGIARLDTNGLLDASFSCNVRSNSSSFGVYCFALLGDGKILIGGYFKGVNGVARKDLARLNQNGSVDTSFPNVLLATGSRLISCCAIQSDGKIVIGGGFTTVSGVTRPYLARLNPNGSRDSTFLSGLAGPDYWVVSVALQPNGKIVIGGSFTSVNGTARTGLARLNANGSLDQTFDVQLSHIFNTAGDVWVDSLGLQTDGKILVGGNFTHINGVPHFYFARLNPDGSVDTPFLRDRAGPDGSINCVSTSPDGSILIGGLFRSVNRIPRFGVARLLATYAPPRLEHCQSLGGQVGFNLCGEEGQRVLVQASTNLQDWTTLATHYLGPVPVPFTDWQSTLLPKRFYRLVEQ